MKKYTCEICGTEFTICEGFCVHHKDTERNDICPGCYDSGIKCVQCDAVLTGEQMESPYENDDNEVMCDDCYEDEYMSVCPICEDSFEKSRKLEDGYYFAITKEAVEDSGVMYNGENMKPGIYKALEYPMYRADIVFGFNYFYDNTIELVVENDFPDGGSYCEEICGGCVEKYKNEQNKNKLRK